MIAPCWRVATLSGDVAQLIVFKRAEDGQGYILRLFEPTGQSRTTTLMLPPLGLSYEIALGPFELKTLRLDPTGPTLTEEQLLEH